MTGAVGVAAATSGVQHVHAPSPEILLDLDAKIYGRDQDLSTNPLGKFHVESKKENELIYSKSFFSDSDGVQLTEEAWDNQGHIKRDVVEDKLLKKTYALEVKDKQVVYTIHDLVTNADKTSSEDATDNLVVPATLVPYLRSFNAELLSNKALKVRMAVLDRGRSYEFEVKKVRTEKLANSETVVVLELKATSFFVRAMVDPMYFHLDPTNFELNSFEGKTSLRLKDGSTYKDLIARTVYHYNVNRFKPTHAALLNTGKPCDSEATLLNPTKCAVPLDLEHEPKSSSSSQ